jgi:hypothetical protein
MKNMNNGMVVHDEVRLDLELILFGDNIISYKGITRDYTARAKNIVLSKIYQV